MIDELEVEPVVFYNKAWEQQRIQLKIKDVVRPTDIIEVAEEIKERKEKGEKKPITYLINMMRTIVNTGRENEYIMELEGAKKGKRWSSIEQEVLLQYEYLSPEEIQYLIYTETKKASKEKKGVYRSVKSIATKKSRTVGRVKKGMKLLFG